MKKNKMMRLASVLLVAVILTTCAISGTFAKYVTSGNGFDSARVAKFGVTVTGTADTFKETYAKDDEGFTLAANTVVSTKDVVAPGTSGSMAAFTLAGTPEVAVRVTFDGTLELGDKWVDSDSAYYCPIEVTVGSTTFKGTDYASADLFEAAVNDEIAGYSNDYAANTDLSTIGADAPAISWEWAFEGNDDAKDTYLGDQAAADNAAEISLDVTATVTQID
ncbi:MAG: hypothetical protein ACI4I4_07135 [Acutalibacteraceae bacterium]